MTKHERKPASPRPKGGIPSPKRAPTMADVARLAGVSTMTVSRALKSDSVILESTRQRILAVCEEIGYILDERAGALSSNQSGFISALVPSINNANFADLARGLTDAAADSGLQILLGYTEYSSEKEEALIGAMLRRRPEAFMLVTGHHSERTRAMLRAAAIPVVEAWDTPEDPIHHTVGFSFAHATATMVRRLHEKGYREIAFLGGTSYPGSPGASRRAGYEAAIRALGLPEGRIVSFRQPPTALAMGQGAAGIVELIERFPGVDAVVCVHDLAAFGALMECRRRGWDVPGRCAIAGFGDFEVSRYSAPRITTIQVDAYALGRMAGGMLLDSIRSARQGRATAARHVTIPFSIEEREST